MSIDSIFESSSSSLPEDLLIKILLYLPVRTLLRFKTVCKSWLALINSSHFIHSHAVAITSSSPDNTSSSKLGTFIFQSSHVFLDFSWNIFTISGGDHEFQEYEDLGMPPCYSKPMSSYNLLMVGSCNGVICLFDAKPRDVSLWNPAIRHFRLLPKPLTFTGVGNMDCDIVAFGFDVETKDYKVVLLTYFFQRADDQSIYPDFRYLYRVQMYNLSTDSWRTLEDVVLPTYPEPYLNRSDGGYLNGSCYWLGWKWIKTGIDEQLMIGYYHPPVMDEVLSFDFTKEIYKAIPLPDGINKNMAYHEADIAFIVLGEKIAIVQHLTISNAYDNTDDYRDVHTYDFWVLIDEVGVKESSWTKLYTIGPYETIQRPIAISNNGEFIFVSSEEGDEKLVLLNPSTEARKELQWDGNSIMRADVYRGSLVPVCSSTGNGSASEPSQV